MTVYQNQADTVARALRAMPACRINLPVSKFHHLNFYSNPLNTTTSADVLYNTLRQRIDVDNVEGD